MNLHILAPKSELSPQLVIVTGESECGKTTWCRQQIDLANDLGWLTAGLLSPAVFQGSSKTGIDLLDIRSGERRRLAHLRTQIDFQAATKKWIFQDEVLVWGNERLGAIETCDLLVIDELGPLEFLHNQGFTLAFDLLEKRRFRVALVVVRPSLLPQAKNKWPQGIVYTVNI